MNQTNNQLTTQKDEETFKEQLNQMTGHKPQSENPIIKYNSSEGKFYKSVVGEDGERINEEIKGTSIPLHIVRADRHIVQSGMGAQVSVGGKETSNYFIDLIDKQTGDVVESGNYKEVKATHPEYDLKYSKVLYTYYDGEPHRMYLGGSKLNHWFDYQSGSNPALTETILKRGKMVKGEKGKTDYYKLEFEKGEAVSQEDIIKRVNDVNVFVNGFDKQAPRQVAPEQEVVETPALELDENPDKTYPEDTVNPF